MKKFFVIPFKVTKITKVFYLESLELYGILKLFLMYLVYHYYGLLICTLKIRAANLSGDCFFAKENFGRFRFGWSKHQQVSISVCYCSDNIIISVPLIGLCKVQGYEVNHVRERCQRQRSHRSSGTSI